MVYAVISYTFLQVYDNIFILIIKFYDLLHEQEPFSLTLLYSYSLVNLYVKRVV